MPENVEEIQEVMDNHILQWTRRTVSTDSLENSEICEQSENSLSSKGGVAPNHLNPEEVMEITFNPIVQENYSEIRECSETSPSSEAGVAVQCTKKTNFKTTPENSAGRKFCETGEQSEISRNSAVGGELTGAKGKSPHEEASEISENSLNSRKLQKKQQEKQNDKKQGDINRYELALNRLSETSEYLQELLEKTGVSKTKDGSDYGEVRKESPKCTGKNVSVPKSSWFKSMSQIIGLAAAWHQDKVEGSPVGAKTVSNTKTNITSVQSEFNFFSEKIVI